MKPFITITTLGFLLFFLVFTGNASSLKLSEYSINFGNIKEGPPVERTIILTNDGADTITIANTVTSCACTTVNLSKSSINPGESTELQITYETFKYPGKFDKTVTIFTGPDGKEETVIHVLGNVDPIPMGVIAMEPRKTVVGELKASEGNPVQVNIKNEGDAPLKISRIYSSKFKKEYFNSEKTGKIEVGAGKIQKIDLVITPPSPGRFLDVIMIYSDARNDIGKGYKGLISGTAK